MKTINSNQGPPLSGHLIITHLGAIVDFTRKCIHRPGIEIVSFWCAVDVVEIVKSTLNKIMMHQKYANAPQNTWVVIFCDGGQIKNDDGEHGAGLVILWMLEQKGILLRHYCDALVYGYRFFEGQISPRVRLCQTLSCTLSVLLGLFIDIFVLFSSEST